MQKRLRSKVNTVVAALLLATGTIACSSSDNAKSPGADAKQPAPGFDYNQTATLKFYNQTSSSDYYKSYFEPHIKKKFPNVTVEELNSGTKGNKVDELVAAKNLPDIYLTTTSNTWSYIDQGLVTNIDPIAKAHKIDLTVFEEPMLQSIRNISPKGELVGLPLTYGSTALFYNKEIFDRYGVAYPKDGMSWDGPELKDMIVKLNRPGDGISGIMFSLGNMLGQNQLSQPFVDSTGKSLLQTDPFKRIIDTFASLYKSGGSMPKEDFDASGQKAFITKRNVAMWAGNAVYPSLIELEKKGQGFNWDVVSLPTFKEAPGVGTQYFGAVMLASAANGKQDLATHVISLLTSAEVQIEGGSIIRFPTLKDPVVKASLGKGEKFLEVKNMKALYLNKIPPLIKPTEFDSTATSNLVAKAVEIIRDGIDTNTALREAAEATDKKIAELKASK
ncbi:MAG: family 1 extracellular solute-binding protein [Paenibacillus sp.]|jgi:multiple sugar transport system substrate-binding protein|nr:family 1 extracellular solute-binding protein [Paenibacillus sp.]